MANMTVTENKLNQPVLEEPVFRDESLTFSAAATVLAGTILARKAVNDAVTVAAGANTGTGTVTASVAPGATVPLVGAYVLTATAAAANGGTFKLEDPNGALVANGLVMTAGAGASTTFEVGGLTFTITDGATDFVAGDSFTLTTAANGKLVPFATNGAGGAQQPKAILTYEVRMAAAGDVAIRAGVAGKYRKERLVIDADGTAANIDGKIIDQLRDYGLVPVNVTDLSVADNS